MVAPLIPVLAVTGFTGAAYVWHRFTRGSSSQVSGGNETVRISGVSAGNYGAGGSQQSTETAAPDWATLFKPVIDVLSTPLVLPTPATTQQTTSTNSATVAAPATTTPAPATTTPATTTPATTTPATTTPATTTPATTPAPATNTPVPAGQMQEAPTTEVITRTGKAAIGNLIFNPIAALFGGGSATVEIDAVTGAYTRPSAPAPSPVANGAGVGRAQVTPASVPERKMTLGFRAPQNLQSGYEATPPSTPMNTQKGPSVFDFNAQSSPTRPQRFVQL